MLGGRKYPKPVKQPPFDLVPLDGAEHLKKVRGYHLEGVARRRRRLLSTLLLRTVSLSLLPSLRLPEPSQRPNRWTLLGGAYWWSTTPLPLTFPTTPGTACPRASPRPLLTSRNAWTLFLKSILMNSSWSISMTSSYTPILGKNTWTIFVVSCPSYVSTASRQKVQGQRCP